MLCSKASETKAEFFSVHQTLYELVEKLVNLDQKHGNAENVDTFKTVVLQGILENAEELPLMLTEDLASFIPHIKNLFSIINKTFFLYNDIRK